MDMKTGNAKFDVIILGGSMTASTLALTLNSQGVSVLMVDSGNHPRFALGESLLKPTVYWMHLLAKKYGVAALDVVADFERVSTEIAPTSGVKRCFGFVRHARDRLRVENQWFVNSPVDYKEAVHEGHIYREDIDTYLFKEARESGVFTACGEPIEAIDLGSEQVSVSTASGTYEARYLVDCGSAKSLIADQLALRETPSRWLTESRSIFSHLVGVRNFEDCNAAQLPGLDWSQGTLHHLLEDAWVWVIPFNNHEKSENSRVSVGVTFFGERSAPTEQTPESEWQSLLARYPALNAQFGDSEAVRPWIGTGKLAYSSKKAIGHRYCLLGQSYGGIDALYSRGMLNTMQCVNLMTGLLCDALEQNNFDEAQFAPIQRLQDKLLDINDRLTFGSYIGFGSSRLTTWWLSLWTQIEQLSIYHVRMGLDQVSGGRDEWDPTSALLEDEMVINTLPGLTGIMQSFSAGDISEDQACDQLLHATKVFHPFGFDIKNSEQLLCKVAFNKDVRNMLQTELQLTKLLDDLGQALGRESSFKLLPGLQTAVQFLSMKIMKHLRKIRMQEVNVDLNTIFRSQLQEVFDGRELAEDLRKITSRLRLVDPPEKLKVNVITDAIQSIAIQNTFTGEIERGEGWRKHLDLEAASGHLRCMTKASEEDGMLTILVQGQIGDEPLEIICQVKSEVLPLILAA